MSVTPYKFKIICATCNGTGTNSEGGVTTNCTDCNQTGNEMIGEIEGAEQIADLTDKVNDCLDKLKDILEKLNEKS